MVRVGLVCSLGILMAIDQPSPATGQSQETRWRPSGEEATAQSAARVCVTLVDRSRLSAGAVECLAIELEQIWRLNGVEVIRPSAATGACAPSVRAVRLWVADDPTQLLPGMGVSHHAVGGTVVIDAIPTDLGYVLLDRANLGLLVPCRQGSVLGRFAAHELGHMLLRTRDHADRGLMRAAFDESDRQRPSIPSDAFCLTRDQQETVQRALVAARSGPTRAP